MMSLLTRKKNPVLFIEVQSSPMQDTLKACLLKGSTLFRYFRHLEMEIIMFALPSINSSSCIVKMEITFRKFQFYYNISCYEMENGINMIMDEAKNSSIPIFNVVQSDLFMPLNSAELKEICGCTTNRCRQMNSHNALLIHCKTKRWMYKVLYRRNEQQNIAFFSKSLPYVPVNHVISLEIVRNDDVFIFRYPRVYFSPLSKDEAKKCLKGFVTQLMVALEEFHQTLKLAHNDIRLPNICFNSNYEAVIIDVDNCAIIGVRNPSLRSCLYEIPRDCIELFKEVELPWGQKRDYMQVGWLIAYVIDNTENEHERQWNHQKECIRSNLFISKLVRRFEYDPSLLSSLDNFGNQTLQEVLDGRNS